jgi:two-component system response regulator MprA
VRVLVVDDEAAVRRALNRALTASGHSVGVAADGLEGLASVKHQRPDVIVLDMNMPNLDGLTFCRQLRSQGDQTPIIVVTARTEVTDRVAGLDAGADDYLVKPFALDELLARLRALARRAGDSGEAPGEIVVGDVTFDPGLLRATRGGREFLVSRTEGRLLEVLMRNAGKPLSREQIFLQVWGYDFGTTSNSHEVYVGYLRRKLEADGEPRLIHTIRGVGYTFDPNR